MGKARKQSFPLMLSGLRWSLFFGQVVKLGSPDEKDGPDDGQAEAVFGGVQGACCAGGVARRVDGLAVGDQARRASDTDRGLEAPGDGLATVFSGKEEAKEGMREEDVEKLHAKIGQLNPV